MKQKVYICNDENCLPSTDGKNIFQQQSMFRFYSALKNYNPFFVVVENEGQIIATLLGVIIKEKNIVPAFLVSRCLIIGEAEFFSDVTEKAAIYELLLDKIDKTYGKKCLFVEWRNVNENESLSPIFEKKSYSYFPWYNVVNELNDDSWHNIKSPKRRQVQKGLKNGAKIIEASHENQIKEFYLILKHLYHNIKKPLPDYEFFSNFFYDFCQNKKGVYLLIEFEGKIIGGMMCPFSSKNTMYEWYIGSLNKEYKSLYPGVLCTYAAIDYGTRNGFKQFDFMGAGQRNVSYGVRNFKLTFGGKLTETCRWKKINFPLLYKIAMLANKLF